MKKRKPLTPTRPRAKDSSLKVEHLGIDPARHAEFKEAMLTAARAGVDAFPGQIDAVKDVLRRTSPLDALAAFASYGMRARLASDGRQKKLLPDIQQHHGELLQAILLTLPPEDWGLSPLTPDLNQTLFDTLPKLADSFYLQRILEGATIEGDKEAMTVRSLQERIRMHTQGVRNWGYYKQVIALCRELYGALDAQFASHHGFSATDTINTLAAMVASFEERQAAHWDVLGKVARGKNARRVAALYFRSVPELVGSADEMLAGLPADIPRRHMLALVMAHFDLRLQDTALFEPAELAARTRSAEPVVTAVLKAISLEPGALSHARPEFLFLDNPVWDRPAIAVDGSYFCPMPQIAFSHIHRLMDRLVAEAGLQQAMTARRATYLERQLEMVFRDALPSAQIRAGVIWEKGGQQFENDLVVVIDRVVVIAEAKSHRLTPQGLRGATDRVKRHIRDMVLDPSIQSTRLEELIATARAGDVEASDVLNGIGIDHQNADRVIRVSVTLDDLSILSASEQEFKEVGWVPKGHALAPTILITDLQCIVDILDNPLLVLHYLSERAHLQKSLNLLGDELDFLGLYLATGFNLTALQGTHDQFSPTGMSGPIDRYYEGCEAGLALPKPKMELRPLYRDIVERVSRTQPPGWTSMGFHLLSSADPAEQRAIEQNLTKLRAFVLKNYRDPQHTSTLIVRPPDKRKAQVMFYVFHDKLRDRFVPTMKQLAAQAMETEDMDACVVFARCAQNWGRAFEAALAIERP